MSDKHKQLATEVDALPDEGLHHVLGCAVPLDYGDTTRSIQAKLAFAPKGITPEAAAAMEASRIAYRKGTLAERAAFLEVCDGPFANLIHYWPLEEAAEPWLDLVGSVDYVGGFGSAFGRVSVAGKNGQGLRLSGTSITHGNGPTYLPLGDPFTLSLWYNPTASLNSQEVIEVPIQVRLVSGRLRLQYIGFSEGPTVLANGTFYHLAYTFDGVNATLYLNGAVEVPAFPGAGFASPITLAGVFGQSVFDEVAMFNTVLSSARIAALYNGGAGLFY